MDRANIPLTIRTLRADDLARLVAMDRAVTGRQRQTWYEDKVRQALAEAGVKISLGAETDGCLAGALLGAVHYGEFGLPEPVAILDTILVDPAFSRRGIAAAMFHQLVKNLKGLRVECLRTEVGLGEFALNGFLKKQGFRPAPRIVLELSLTSVRDAALDEA